jgi:hypothetical protein
MLCFSAPTGSKSATPLWHEALHRLVDRAAQSSTLQRVRLRRDPSQPPRVRPVRQAVRVERGDGFGNPHRNVANGINPTIDLDLAQAVIALVADRQPVAVEFSEAA